MTHNSKTTASPDKSHVGVHLIGDLYGCQNAGQLFYDADALRDFCVTKTQDAGLTVVGEIFHQFGEKDGVTGAVVLAESHLAIHTWPEKNYVTLDVYVCNYSQDNRAKAQMLFDTLVAAFAPETAHTHKLERE